MWVNCHQFYRSQEDISGLVQWKLPYVIALEGGGNDNIDGIITITNYFGNLITISGW